MEKFSSQSRVTPRSRTAEENVRRGKAADKAAMSKAPMMKVMTCVVAIASEAEQCNYYVLNTSEKYSKGLYKINVQVLICVYAYTYMLA